MITLPPAGVSSFVTHFNFGEKTPISGNSSSLRTKSLLLTKFGERLRLASVSFSRGGVLTQLESKLITSVAIPMVLTLGFAEGAKARVTAMCMASFCQGVLATAYLRADDPQPAVPW